MMDIQKFNQKNHDNGLTMTNNKFKLFFMVAIILLLISVQGVMAQDIDDNINQTELGNDLGVDAVSQNTLGSTQADVLSEGEGTFSELNTLIQSGGVIDWIKTINMILLLIVLMNGVLNFQLI